MGGVNGEGAANAAPSASKESGLDLIALTKVFPGGTVAVEDVDLHIDHGEYVVLLGPSGCGKTTTLRMIGGHEFPTEGDIVLDGQSLVGLAPHKRPTTTVFQHFALFPHRSVIENVEFGLKMHGVQKDERRRQASDALEMVGLSELSDRKPRALSGGQQQRVALARVLVTKPKALLLDEPLGDLDRLLQLRMRVELRNLQRQLGLMFIHVTHNQEEALSMADRIVVMNEARIQQIADPLTIATKPATELVARFMGDNNIIRGKVVERALGEVQAHRRAGWTTLAWGLPGFVWLGFYLVAPLVFIILVSFWTRTDTGFVKTWTLSNYGDLFHPFSLNNSYWKNMLTSFETSVIAVAACLVFGFPVAYFLALKVQKLQNQIALFIIALAPFWTSFLTRAVAWAYPLMGREGALNQALLKLHIVSQPVSAFGFSQLSVRLAMIQLYILFMVTPLFFLLGQVGRYALEAARDLGGTWWRTFREVILPQTMPGIVIGSIFIFVLTMGEYGTVTVIGQGAVSSVGTIIYSKTGAIEYPQGAPSAVLLVGALMAGVFVITRFANLREEL